MTHINWKSEQDKISFIIKEKIAKLDTLINDNKIITVCKDPSTIYDDLRYFSQIKLHMD